MERIPAALLALLALCACVTPAENQRTFGDWSSPWRPGAYDAVPCWEVRAPGCRL
jgi:hypothetical protein